VAALLLDEKVLALARTLEDSEIPHAFGGALALAYYATPRGTVDIDVNFFVPTRDAKRVLPSLEALGVSGPSRAEAARLERDGQVRLRWGRTPIDCFFSYDPFHDHCMERRRSVPFGEGDAITILSAEDLAVFKVIFDRDKDWDDLRELLYAQAADFDADTALDWLRRILGDAPRIARFEALLGAPNQGASRRSALAP
jgi:hypothetical protein